MGRVPAHIPDPEKQPESVKQYSVLYLAVLLLLLTACSGKRKEAYQPNWTPTLEHNDKIPYGTHLAFRSLKYYFPGAQVKPLSRWYRYNSMSESMQYGSTGTSLMVLHGFRFNLSEDELDYLLRYVTAGNEVLLFSNSLDNKLEQKLGCRQVSARHEEIPLNVVHDGKDNRNALWTVGDSATRYGYQGRYLKGYFLLDSNKVAVPDSLLDTLLAEADSTAPAEEDSLIEDPYAGTEETTEDGAVPVVYDTTVYEDGTETAYDDETTYESDDESGISAPQVLGMSETGPDFIRYRIGNGHLTLHAAPLVLSNYFLLQGRNKDYLSYIWKTVPEDIETIYWHDYYKRSAESSDLGVMFRYPATRWALLLALLTLFLFVLFEAKRRQRIIPIVPPLENSSVSFVETVGRLYYNKGNHLNLAEKMVQHFLEYVRSNYFLNTNQIDDHFIYQLSVKSGQPEALVRSTAELIHEVRLRSVAVDESYLYHLHNTLQNFYKK